MARDGSAAKMSKVSKLLTQSVNKLPELHVQEKSNFKHDFCLHCRKNIMSL